MVAIVSAKGGVGKTTIATNVAVALRQLTAQEVALVDVDAQFGESALVMGLDVNASIADLVRDEPALSRQAIANYVVHHPSGVDVLAAPMEPADWRALTPEQLAAVIQGLAEGHEYVLVDTPAMLLEVTNAALHEAAVVLLVTSLELTSVKNAKTALRMLDSWSIPEDRVRLIVNDPSHAGGVTVEDVASATGMEVALQIEYDAGVGRAYQAGEPMVLAQPNGNFSHAIDVLARGLAGMPAQPRGGGRSLFRRISVVGRRS